MKIDKFLYQEKTLLMLLFLMALIIRLVVGILMFSPPVKGDARIYENFALSILQGQGMAGSSTRLPLYPMFLAGIYFIAGHNHYLVVIIQAILSALICIFLYYLAKRLFNTGIAWLAAVFSCFNLAFIYMPRFILTETLNSFLILASMLFFVKFLTNYKIIDILFATVFLSLANLTHPLIFFYPFFIAIYLIRRLSRLFTPTLAYKTVSLFVIVFLLPLGIWIVRNYRIHHAFIPLTTMGGESLYHCYVPEKGKIYGIFPRDEVFENAPQGVAFEIERQKYFLDKTLEHIRANYNKLPKLILLRIMYFLSPFDWEIIGCGVYNYSFAFILPFMFIGLITSFKYSSDSTIWIIYSLIFYNLFMVLLLYGSPRLRIPVEPYLILFSASGFYYLWQKFKNKLIIGLSTFAFFGINYFAYLFSSQTKSLFKCLFEKLRLW